MEQDLSRAETRLATVDRLDLIGWLDEAQRNENRWRQRFYELLGDVRQWSEHLVRQQNPEPAPDGETAGQAQRRDVFARLWRLSEEILSAPDPLAAIIEKHTPNRANSQQDDEI